jgi:hypothetical protein
MEEPQISIRIESLSHATGISVFESRDRYVVRNLSRKRFENWVEACRNESRQLPVKMIRRLGEVEVMKTFRLKAKMHEEDTSGRILHYQCGNRVNIRVRIARV